MSMRYIAWGKHGWSIAFLALKSPDVALWGGSAKPWNALPVLVECLRCTKAQPLEGGLGEYSFEVTRLDWVFAAQSECMSLCHFGRGFNLCLHFEKAMLFFWLVGLLALYYTLQIILLSHIRLSALTPPCSPPLSPPLSPPRPLPCTPSVHENSPNFFHPTVNNRTLQICTPWSEYKYTLVQISNIYTWIRTFVSCFITIRLIPTNPFTRDLIYNSASSPQFPSRLAKIN